MRLSTRTRYGTRAMLELAASYGDVISSREISEQQDISLKYLEQLLTVLRAAGLVRSVRGARGGYGLSRSPDQITLYEIYSAFEGQDGFAECTSAPEICDRTDSCVVQEVWALLHEKCKQVLESITLEDLVLRTRSQLESAIPLDISAHNE